MIPPVRCFGPAADVPLRFQEIDVPLVRHAPPRGRAGVACRLRSRRLPRPRRRWRRPTRCGRSSASSPPTRWRAGGPARPARPGPPVPGGADAELRAGAGGRQQLLPAVPYEVVTGPRGRDAPAAGSRAGADTAAARAGHRLQPDRADPRLGPRGARPGGRARRPLRPLGIGKPVAGDSIYNGADDDASGVAAVLAAARALAKAPPRRTSSSSSPAARSSACSAPSGISTVPTFPLARTVADLQVEMVGRPDSLAGGAGQALAHRLRAVDDGRELRPGRASGGGRPAAGLQVLRAQRQHRLRAARAFPRTRSPPSACTPTTTSRRTRWSGSTSPIWQQAADVVVRATRILADGPAPTWRPGGRPTAVQRRDDEGPRPRLDPQARAGGLVERQRPAAGRVAGLLHAVRAGADPDRGDHDRGLLLRRRGGAGRGDRPDRRPGRGDRAPRRCRRCWRRASQRAGNGARHRDRADHLLPRRHRRVPRAADRAQRASGG